MVGHPFARGFVVVLSAAFVALICIVGFAAFVLLLAASAVAAGPLLVILLLYMAAAARERLRAKR